MNSSTIPNIKDLISVFKNNSNDDKELLNLWTKKNDYSGWLSRSAWSLVLIVIWRKKILSEDRKINIWVPDFFCNSSIDLLRKLNVNITFYQIDSKLEPNYSTFNELIIDSKPDIFLFVHYFGFALDSAKAKQFCSNNKTWLVEDAVHTLIPFNSVGKFGDFVIYSPHKLFPIPNGSVLIIRSNGPSKINVKSYDFIYDKTRWLELLYEFIYENKIKLNSSSFYLFKWFFKKILLMFGFRRKISLKYKEELKSDKKSQLFFNPKISSLSIKILSRNKKNIFKIKFQRQKNNILWNYYLKENFSKYYVNDFIESDKNNFNYSPYLSFINIKKNKANKIFNELQLKKTYVSTWPDLPPEVIENKTYHRNAWNLRHSLVFLPCHQSISSNSFFKLLKNKTVLSGIEIKIIENNLSRSEWNKFLIKNSQSNLLQSWMYGDSKSKIEGWKLKRLAFKNENKILAVVNLLEKKIMGFKIIRVNRGPLFSNETTDFQKYLILKRILEFGNFKKLSLLFFSPELDLSGKNLAFFISNKLKFFKSKNWNSSRINLSNDIDTIKANFNGTWRYNLSRSQKNNLNIESGSDENLFNWLIEKYSINMKEKNFKGISISILKSIINDMQDDCKIISFRVIKNDNPISGSCFAVHGDSATYLIGWTDLEGRKLNANHFQLWNVIIELKNRNLKWMDLGGIDIHNTPGISEFKLGMGGNFYSLVGDGVKWN